MTLYTTYLEQFNNIKSLINCKPKMDRVAWPHVIYDLFQRDQVQLLLLLKKMYFIVVIYYGIYIFNYNGISFKTLK